MRILKLAVLAAFHLPGIALAQAGSCEYAEESVNPITDEKIVATKWQAIKQGTGTGISIARGYVRGISEGDDKYLGVRIGVSHYRPIPPELGISLDDTNVITKKGKFDPRLDPFVEELQNTPFKMPAGVGLRITLEDRTNVVVSSDEDSSFLPEVTKPQWDDNRSAEYRLAYRVASRYVLGADAIALLSNNRVVSLRLELPYQDYSNKYYYFGHRNLIWDDKVITEKTMATIQGVLKCVM